jgi:hypothetical protein
MSVFSKSYWINKGFSEEEAVFQVSIRRPNNINYYLNKGVSEEEARDLVKERQSKGGAKRKSMSIEEKRKLSPRCIEFWTEKGLSESNARIKLSEFQTTFSKSLCIEKYGLEDGMRIWTERQLRWQESLYSKSENEIKDINRRKNRWKNLSDEEAIELKIKIGATIKETVSKRPTEVTKEIFERIVNSKIQSGQYIPRDQLNGFEKYKRLVWIETRKNDLTLLENYNRRGRKDFHLDHMYSIWQGFVDKTPPEITGHIKNLKMLHYKENISKHTDCSISLEQLKSLISNY